MEFKQQHIFESVLEKSVQTGRDISTHFVPMPGRAPSCLSQHASSGVYSQHSLHSTRRTGCGQFSREANLSNSSIISKKKMKTLFTLFLFFQIKINYNPYLLINAGWSCP